MADEQTPENIPVHRWLKTPLGRRDFLKGAVKVGAGLAAGGAVGFGAGREFEYRYENPTDITIEPLEIQIRKVELRAKGEGLRDENLRGLYTWLITSWYGANHSFGAFADPDNEYSAAQAMYSSISFIEDEKDPKLVGFENAAGWTVGRESIFMNLTSPELKEDYVFNTSGGTITPFMQMRDTLVHELTHFIVEDRKDAQIIDMIRQTKPEVAQISDVTIRGFRMLFDPDPNNPAIPVILYLNDFDEAATELIASYYQRTAGLAVGLPSYPEGDQSETGQYRIEKTIDALEAALKLSGISMDQFAQLHAHSDLDLLAKTFAESTNRSFQNDIEKIQYGLLVIIAIKDLDRKYMGEHIQNIKT